MIDAVILFVGKNRFELVAALDASRHVKGDGILYVVTPDRKVTEKLKKVSISNGIVWSSDKKFMYYNDTPTNRIARYRYNDSTGEILYDGVAVNIPKGTGSPDGMTIDSNDNLWVAQWGGSGVYCYSPYTGELLMKVNVPALHELLLFVCFFFSSKIIFYFCL